MPPTNQTPAPQPQQPAPAPQPVAPLDPALPETPVSPPPKDKKSLMIALIVAAVLLLAAGGIAWWLWQSKTPTPGAQNNQPQTKTDDISGITKVTWQAPTTTPEGFALVSQTANEKSFSNADGCQVIASTSAKNSIDMQGAADAAEAYKKLAEFSGAKITLQEALDDTTLLDVDGKNSYTFKGQEMAQEISFPGVPAAKAHSQIWYKDFGETVASLVASCKEAAWTTHAAAIEPWLHEFAIETERS